MQSEGLYNQTNILIQRRSSCGQPVSSVCPSSLINSIHPSSQMTLQADILLQNGLTWWWSNPVQGSRWEPGPKTTLQGTIFCAIHSSCVIPQGLRPKEFISKKAFLQTGGSDECLPSLEAVTALGSSHTPNYDCLARPEYRWKKPFLKRKHDVEDKKAQWGTQHMHWDPGRKAGLRKWGSLPLQWLMHCRALSGAGPSVEVFCFCY